MSCYHPLVAFRTDHEKTFRGKYRIFGSLDNLGSWEDVKRLYEEVDPVLIPCGKCCGCRLDKSRRWADRMALEFDHTKKACFLTLTYEDSFLPLNKLGLPTLVKSDMQTFMKDLRGNKYYDGKEIRFYGSGEYGDKPVFGCGSFRYGRPHLHIIIFGLGIDDFTDGGYFGPFQFPDFYVGKTDHKLYYAGENKFHQPYWRSPHLDNVVWKKGRVCVAEFSWKTAAYVARYVQKKLDGPLGANYTSLAIEPPFSLMSRRPGIAGFFMADHPEKDFFEETSFSFQGLKKPIPDFLFDKLEKVDSVRYYKIKQDRKKFAEDKMLLELQQTDLSYEELLAIKECHHEAVSTNLIRPLE